MVDRTVSPELITLNDDDEISASPGSPILAGSGGGGALLDRSASDFVQPVVGHCLTRSATDDTAEAGGPTVSASDGTDAATTVATASSALSQHAFSAPVLAAGVSTSTSGHTTNTVFGSADEPPLVHEMTTTNAAATAYAGASTNASAIAASAASGATSCSAAGRSSGDTAEPMDTSSGGGSGGGSGGVSVAAAEADDGQCCTICFETWSNSGSHRIASLRCGHLFGLSCIERWLRGREQRCPHCNEKASVRDIRAVFAKSVRVLDTSERDRALSELNTEKECRRKLELDYSIIKLKCRMQETEIVRLQRELHTLRRSVARGSDTCLSINGHNSGQPCSTRHDTLSLSAAAASATTSSFSAAAAASAGDPLLSMSGVPSLLPSQQQQLQLESDRWSLALQANVSVARSGGCRVMRHSHWLQLLAVSQPSHSQLFPGYGVRKVNTLDMRPAQYVALHSKQVRDLAFQPQQRDMLLSVALDCRAVLTNVSAGARVHTWTTGAPCWSCTWDRRRQYCCYVGLSSGAVMAVDWRRPDRPLARVDCGGGSGSPVVGLCHVAHTAGVDALVVCRLSSCSVLTLSQSQAGSGFLMEDAAATARGAACSESVLPLAGPFTSLSVSEETGHVLVSARPSARQPHTTHAVCHLSAPASPLPPSAAATPSDDATTTTAAAAAAAAAAGGGVGGGVEVDSTCTANVVRLVYGDTSQRLMSRSALLPWPQRPDQLLLAAGQECSRSVQLWSVQSGTGVQRLAAGEPVLDVCSVMGGGQSGAAGGSVAVLNEHRLAAYSWREKS